MISVTCFLDADHSCIPAFLRFLQAVHRSMALSSDDNIILVGAIFALTGRPTSGRAMPKAQRLTCSGSAGRRGMYRDTVVSLH